MLTPLGQYVSSYQLRKQGVCSLFHTLCFAFQVSRYHASGQKPSVPVDNLILDQRVIRWELRVVGIERRLEDACAIVGPVQTGL
jgi:hypothetical protein